MCKVSATREIPEMVLSCDLPIFPCNGEIVQHVNLPWNRQIAACASAMKLSNCSTAWYRRIVELSNYSMGHLPWNFQVAASDKRCKLHFWPIPRLHAPNDKFVGKRFSDWTTIRRRFQWFVDCCPARIQTMSGGSWIETIRLQWFVDCRPTRFQTMSGESSACRTTNSSM